VKWVGSFISNKTMTLCLPEHNTNAFFHSSRLPPGRTTVTHAFPLIQR
jgi:hypothetical protein